MKLRLLVIAVGAIVLLMGQRAARAEQAPLTPPTISGQRAIVVDTLTNQVLYEKQADSKALQGSIAKIMTASVALDQIKKGVVSFNDPVTISARAQAQACTCLVDLNNDGVSDVKAGEIFTLQDLLYGLAVSAGEATDAVAEYVGSAVFFNKQPATSVSESELRMKKFVGLMNQQVADLGLKNTTFVTVHGGDGCDFAISCDPNCNDTACAAKSACPKGAICNGGTTPRDLMAIWRHATQDPFFLKIMGERSYGPFTSIGTPNPTTANTYKVGKGYTYYPDVDGDKNGGSLGCWPAGVPNPTNSNGLCWMAQATRAGRTLIAVVMQTTSWTNVQNDMEALLHYGFARVFGPDRLGDSGTQGVAVQQHALACSMDGGVAVSAMRTPANQLALSAWSVGGKSQIISDYIIKAGSWSEAPGANANVSDVDAAFARPGLFVAAVVKGTSVELASWMLGSSGGLPGTVKITRLQDSGTLAGPGAHVRLLYLADGLLVSGVTDAAGSLTLKSWGVGWDGALTLLSSTSATGAPSAQQFELAGGPAYAVVGRGGSAFQVVAVARTANLAVRLHSWLVKEDSGAISVLGSSGMLDTTLDNVAVARTGVGRFAVSGSAGTGTNGNLVVTFWHVGNDGSFAHLGDAGGASTDLASDTAISALGPTGANAAITVAKDAGGNIKLAVWELPEPQLGAIEGPVVERRLADSGALGGGGDQLHVCRMPNNKSAGDYVAALRTPAGTLKLTAWRSGAKP